MTKVKAYKVGYGKPPKASRYKPGQSGNPKGRPRRLLSEDFSIHELFVELYRRVAVLEVAAAMLEDERGRK